MVRYAVLFVLILKYISALDLRKILPDDNLHEVLLSGQYDFIDLTHDVNNDTIVWPGGERYHNIRQVASNDGSSWYAANDFCVAEHAGTHLDAEYHFLESGLTVGQIPTDNLITALVVVKVHDHVKEFNASFVLRKEHVQKILIDTLSNTKTKTTIFFNFNWSQYYQDSFAFLGGNTPGSLNFPGIHTDTVEFIAENFKNVVGIGVDTASVDPGSAVILEAHKAMAVNGLYNIENAKLPNSLPGTGCVALIMPMKIARGTGAPVRLFAICRRH